MKRSLFAFALLTALSVFSCEETPVARTRLFPETVIATQTQLYPWREQSRGYLGRYANQPLLVDPDRWTADILIPRSALKGISASEGRIPLNVCRSRQVDDGLKGGNYYVWGDFVKGFPDVQNFGTINFKSGKEMKGSAK